MVGPEPRSKDEMSEINARLEAIQDTLTRFQQASGQMDQHMLPPARGDILEVIVSQVMDDVEEGLARNMVRRCEMREPCRSTFTAFLQKNASLLEHDTVREEVIITNQDELDRLRETSPYDKCTKCFNEVSRLFGKQIRLMRSMRIYSTTSDKRQEIAELQEDDFVKNVLEPIASKHRLQILKAVSQETKTFSSLAETTGLRGGNLLFHLQRLLDAGMMLQRRDRGDYLITEKGFKVLKGVSDVHQLLK
jgi:DNA-binding transcriptional ArsR family regulator